MEVPGKGVHNVVYVATEHDRVYAFGADGKISEPLWTVSFAHPEAGVTPVPAHDMDCPFITPEVDVTSTPLIDLKTGTLYALARTKERKGTFSADEYVQRLHALAITSGVEKFGGPVVIQASVLGRGAGSAGQVRFNPLRDNPRAPLLLVNDLQGNDRVYLTWASSCDVGPYHGWVMAYDAHPLGRPVSSTRRQMPRRAGSGRAIRGPQPIKTETYS